MKSNSSSSQNNLINSSNEYNESNESNESNKSNQILELENTDEFESNNAYSKSSKNKYKKCKSHKKNRRILQNQIKEDLDSYNDSIYIISSQSNLEMLNEFDNSHSSGLYTPNMVSFLDKNIRTRANKYNKIIEQDLKNKSNLNSSNEHKDYHHNKYDITKHLHNWPTLAGGAIGATYGSYIGGLIGATAGGALKVIQSQRVYDAMTKKEFVDELIRLGRIPKTEKQRLTKELSSNPVLKTELINILFKKDDEKNN